MQFDALHVHFSLRERAIVLLSGQAARNFNIITKGPLIPIFILNLGEYSQDKWHSALGFVILTLPSCPPGTLMHYRLWITAGSLSDSLHLSSIIANQAMIAPSFTAHIFHK